MKIDKVKDAVNVYKIDGLSFGQLTVIANSLGMNHADPVADEMNFEIAKYLELLPGPGEEKGPGGNIVPQGRKIEADEPKPDSDLDDVAVDVENEEEVDAALPDLEGGSEESDFKEPDHDEPKF